ncbi:MAG: hypothetical protein IKE90_00040 [Bacilli bacterium]|nr:hypothetical protein [Bacilli bacterium]
MLEKYYKYKLNYRMYLILIKIGSFYECFDKDAFIINKLFNYKLKKVNNSFKLGFLIKTIDKIILKLNEKNINHLVVDEEIIKKEFKENNYLKYNFNMEEILYNTLRVEKIIDYLNDNIFSINDKLGIIEEIIN